MKHLFSLLVTVGLAVSAVSAQQLTDVTEIKQPGDLIRLEIKFEGPDIAKIRAIGLSFSSTTAVPSDQAGFNPSMNSPQFRPTSPGIFIVEYKIAEVATGDYDLTVYAVTDAGNINYINGREFRIALFHIRNPKTFTRPHISVTVLGEKR